MSLFTTAESTYSISITFSKRRYLSPFFLPIMPYITRISHKNRVAME